MTVKRFEQIRRNLHFSNNDDINNISRQRKIFPVYEHFNKAFQIALYASKKQSIDERMVKFKGHNICKQYIKNKPIKWGFKLWIRACAKGGYEYESRIYTGKKKSGFEENLRLGEGVVLGYITLTVCYENERKMCQLLIKAK